MAGSAPPPYLVVGIGGDSESLPAAQWSVREAEARNLQVVVAHGSSIPYGDPQLLSGVVDAIVAEAEAVVARAMSHLTIGPWPLRQCRRFSLPTRSTRQSGLGDSALSSNRPSAVMAADLGDTGVDPWSPQLGSRVT